MREAKDYKVGVPVVYVNPFGRQMPALITIWWDGKSGNNIEAYRAESGEPGCNLVTVVEDVEKTDCYGRQIERYTSIVHKTKQPAHGSYWCWPEEV
jgi:hypothetical protein